MISYPLATVHCYLDEHVVVYTAKWQRSTKTGTAIRAIAVPVPVPVHPVISVVLDLTIESSEDDGHGTLTLMVCCLVMETLIIGLACI
jgi:hypothetical protein